MKKFVYFYYLGAGNSKMPLVTKNLRSCCQRLKGLKHFQIDFVERPKKFVIFSVNKKNFGRLFFFLFCQFHEKSNRSLPKWTKSNFLIILGKPRRHASDFNFIIEFYLQLFPLGKPRRHDSDFNFIIEFYLQLFP
jgi:hypothetical protein